MGISRPDFSRFLAEARGIVAKGLVSDWAIRIEGGNYEFTGEALPGRGRRRCRRSATAHMSPVGQEMPMSQDEAGASDASGSFSAMESVSGPAAEPATEFP